MIHAELDASSTPTTAYRAERGADDARDRARASVPTMPRSTAAPTGATLRFRRRDRPRRPRRDGRLVVIDYKTGRPYAVRRADDDPLAGGDSLQLPIYAHAARAPCSAPDDAPVEA